MSKSNRQGNSGMSDCGLQPAARLPGPPPLDILQVAVAAPLPQLFDYLAPSGMAHVGMLGRRVLVPFGQGRRVGLVVGYATQAQVPTDKLKPIERCLDGGALFSNIELKLLRWAAGYYHCVPGEAYLSALPARLRRIEPPRRRNPVVWRVKPGPLASLNARQAPRQAAVLAALAAHPEGLSANQLRGLVGDAQGALLALERKGLLERCMITADALAPLGEDACATLDEAAAFARASQVEDPILSDEQRAAVEAVAGASGFACFLLDGVTGSGKTEVYIRLIRRALAQQRQALVLVPEIGLTPQLAQRFSERIATAQAVLHSGLDEHQREAAWQRAASGQARLVLGTRSAVFTPMPDLGLIIVDEEHDVSLKQQDGFRYSARDVAVRRAQLCACPVLLGSATPSLETLRNASLGRYELLRLTKRAGGAAPPRFLVADLRAQPLTTGLSHALLTRMEQVLDAGNQVLLFLNRRGFSPVLTCHDCGWISECRHCDARMTLHRGRAQLICHHCGHQDPQPVHCPYCDSPDLRPLGQGTERVEDSLRTRFPGIPLARIDRDSTRRKGELARILNAAQAGDYPILLGTQMLAKGHHLPQVTLVGILDIDQGLYGADFRASERMAQLLIQVAGRAGREQRPGTVLIQTRHPQHPLLQRLLHQGYRAFAAAALEERAAAALPPFSFQALIRADSREEQLALQFLRDTRAQALALHCDGVTLWGPAPAAMERRAGRFRAQLLLQSQQRAALHALLERLSPWLRHSGRGNRKVRWSIDIDPQEAT